MRVPRALSRAGGRPIRHLRRWTVPAPGRPNAWGGGPRRMRVLPCEAIGRDCERVAILGAIALSLVTAAVIAFASEMGGSAPRRSSAGLLAGASTPVPGSHAGNRPCDPGTRDRRARRWREAGRRVTSFGSDASPTTTPFVPPSLFEQSLERGGNAEREHISAGCLCECAQYQLVQQFEFLACVRFSDPEERAGDHRASASGY